MTDPTLRPEIEATRSRLVELCHQAGENAPFSQDPPRLRVPITPEEMAEVVNYARQFQTSPASLGHLAVRNLLTQLRQGARPMVMPSTLKNVVATSYAPGEEPWA